MARIMRKFRLAVEMIPAGVSKPVAVGVFDVDGEKSEHVGYADIEQVRAVVAEWDAMVAARKTAGYRN